MHVTISNIEFDVENSAMGVDNMFLRIDEAMQDFGVHFSHVLVDGVEATGEPRDYIAEHLERINNIEVIFLTQDQYLGQVMGIMDSFLENAVPALKAIADEFYGKPDEETWGRFDACLSGISSLLGIINDLAAIPALVGKTKSFAELGESITLHLDNLLIAAKLHDYTLMADILNFELVKFLEALHEAVTTLVRSQDYATH